MQSIATNLLLIPRESLIPLNELRDVGVIRDFEHGDSLDCHFGGAGVDVSVCS